MSINISFSHGPGPVSASPLSVSTGSPVPDYSPLAIGPEFARAYVSAQTTAQHDTSGVALLGLLLPTAGRSPQRHHSMATRNMVPAIHLAARPWPPNAI